MPKKGISSLNQKKEYNDWVLHIQISLHTKFQFKLTFLFFFDQICPENYFQPKTEKVNITIEFCIFELVKVPYFSLNWQFWCFGPTLPKKSICSGQYWKKVNNLWILYIWNLPQKGISSQKQKKWTSPLNSAYSNYSWYQIST